MDATITAVQYSATFTAVQWAAAFTRANPVSIPATWAEMTQTWADYSYLTWAEMT